jgi:hypothetical protein
MTVTEAALRNQDATIDAGLCLKPQIIDGYDGPGSLIQARERATTALYVVSDNDVIPAQPDTIARGLEVMRQHPTLGVLGYCWQKPKKEPYGTWLRRDCGDYWKVGYCGGLWIVRREAVSNWCAEVRLPVDYANGIGEDRLFCEAVERNGYDIGVLPDRWFCHLGEGQSTIWPNPPTG